ncbi:MAG: bifunctional oligoribonuclease/PAP phosphatase NrnA [Planctomycetes bacterium]|nr:bifunctional oligoribonuclease/PAP phosphatase NrnA [Planctomycetota bacterium]
MTPPTHRIAPASRRMVRRILAYVRRHTNFLISGHVRSDGDALGSQLAFHHLLRRLGKKSHVVCDRGVAPEYRFLPGSEAVGSGPEDLHPPYTAVFTFDSGSWARLERVSAALDRSSMTVVNIDHHASNERFGDINWVDPTFSSSGEMVWELVKASGVKASPSMALNIYTAMVTDTGGFAFSNTTTETLLNAAELVALGVRPADVTRSLYRQKSIDQLRFLAAVIERIQRSEDGRVAWVTLPIELERKTRFRPGDTQEYINTLMQLQGTEIAILLRELEDPPVVKVSWRTGQGVDGIELARQHGGGGHPRASGATLRIPLEEAARHVVQQAVDYLRERATGVAKK